MAMQKMLQLAKKSESKRAKNKKGFTLVELVIVIAILAILAAIAIPVITTTINSAKMSAMESDKETIDILLKVAVAELDDGLQMTSYGGAPVSSATKVQEILKENNLENVTFTRTIGGVDYYMVWTGKMVEISTTSANILTSSMTLGSLMKIK